MELEKGWYRCNRCQSLVNMSRLAGSCVGGDTHAIRNSFDYKAVIGSGEGDMQPGWGACPKCASLFYRGNPGTCTDRGAHEVPDYEPQYFGIIGPYPDAEQGWRWCSKCQVMFATTRGPGVCFAGEVGDVHDPTGSGEYTVLQVTSGLQDWWCQCRVCQSLVRGQSPGCVDGTDHSVGLALMVAFGGDREGAQTGWRVCSRCSTLVYGVTSPGVCNVKQADGSAQAHEFTESLPYMVAKDINPIDEQPGWRLCSKCQVLTLTAFDMAVCAAGDTHDLSQSGSYTVLPSDAAEGSRGWRVCRKCRAMVLGVVSTGRCRDGTAHDPTGSRAYQVPAGNSAVGLDPSWHWCRRCQGLVAADGPSFSGVCFDGTPHDHTEGRLYGLPRDYPPENGEQGWRKCVACRQLVMTDSALPVGICANETVHDITGSLDYLISFQAPPPTEPPVANGPALTVIEAVDGISVGGTEFTAGAAVEVSVVIGTRTVTVKSTVAADGTFKTEFTPVEAAPSLGALVLGRDDEGLNARAVLTSFVPVMPPA